MNQKNIPLPDARVWVNIDTEALRHNFRQLRKKAAGLQVRAVLKADAYGLGAEKIAPILKEEGADLFCVACYKEAADLLKFGVPIQLLGPVFDFELADAVANKIILPIGDIDAAERINAEAERQGVIANCHFKLYTGMGRTGILAAHAPDVIRYVKTLKNLNCDGIYSHFPNAYPEDDCLAYSNRQIERFKRVLQNLERSGITFDHIHFGNSDATSFYDDVKKAPFTAIRTGLSLYGLASSAIKHCQLKSVATLHARLAAFRVLPAGSCIGYNRTCQLKKDTLTGTVSAGYADGLPLSLSNNMDFIFRGRRCPVLGRISMDYTVISLDGFITDDLKQGDAVTLIGGEGNVITWEDWAEASNIHIYNLLTSLGPRVLRNYI